MRIDGIGSPDTLRPRARAGRQAGFIVSDEPALVPDEIAARTAMAASELGGARAYPAADDPAIDGARDRAGRRHGRAMLDALAQLQRAMLGDGGTRQAPRAALLALHATLPEVADPRLGDVLQAIRTRIAVELARGDGLSRRRSSYKG